MVTVTPVLSQAETAELTYDTSVTGVACFIEPRTRRFISANMAEVQTDFDAMFLPTQDMKPGYRLTSAVRKDGSSIAPGIMVVESTETSEHPLDGNKLLVAFARLTIM